VRLLKQGAIYAELVSEFRHRVPGRFNIGVDAIDAQIPDRLALIYERPAGDVRRYTFGELLALSNRLANAFTAIGIGQGDRVAILLGQRPETALAHVTVYRMGAIAVPLCTQFGPDALVWRLGNAEAKAVVTDGANVSKIREIASRLPSLRSIIVTEPEGDAGDHEFWRLLAGGRDVFVPVDTSAEDPALLIYTSGTSGPPKGALHAHRVMWGHYPGIEFTHDFFPQPGDLFWTPADWAWGGGLLDCLLPAWHYGVPVLANRPPRFDPEQALRLMARHGVRNTFLPPTALKLMRQVSEPQRLGARPRSIATGGETAGAELIEWGRSVFGLTMNEFWGQTEANLLCGNSSVVHEVRPGSLGRPMPGHDVEVLGEDGAVLPPGEWGVLAARGPDPVFLLEYWRNPDGTRDKYRGEWWLTGDIARKDEDGFIWFQGRDDDVISSGSYRVGPGEIEDCILKHPAVAMAAVIGAPDEVRGEVPKAFVLLKPGHTGSPELAGEIKAFVKTRVAPYQYPRDVEFVMELPLTATGKIVRRTLRDQERARQALSASLRD
jgi:acetyl-CoA synthetase